MIDHGVVDELDSLTFKKLARRLPDELWQVFESVLPPVIWCGNGRPPVSNRACLHAALFILISGTPWKQMPPGFPCGKTVHKRLGRWLKQDAFRQVWSACAQRYQREHGINLDQLSVDGARKPAKKGARQPAPTRPTAPSAARR
jgi:transposase